MKTSLPENSLVIKERLDANGPQNLDKKMEVERYNSPKR
jgi:hypothetical protein